MRSCASSDDARTIAARERLHAAYQRHWPRIDTVADWWSFCERWDERRAIIAVEHFGITDTRPCPAADEMAEQLLTARLTGAKIGR